MGNKSDSDLRPGSFLKAEGEEDEAGELVGKNTDPDAVQAKLEAADQNPCDEGADQGDGNQGSEEAVFHIAGASEAAAEDNLGNLEEDNDDDVVADDNAHIKDGRIGEEQ